MESNQDKKKSKKKKRAKSESSSEESSSEEDSPVKPKKESAKKYPETQIKPKPVEQEINLLEFDMPAVPL